MTMTDNLRVRAQNLMERFDFCTSPRNPYTKGGEAFRKWYSEHSRSEPIPEGMLPTEEELRAYDQERREFIANGLYKECGYSGLKEYYEGCKEKRMRETVKAILERERPCMSGDAQCTFDCCAFGKEECYGKENL